MIKRWQARRHHRKALWLFRECYRAYEGLRYAYPDMVRSNVSGRHKGYREILNIRLEAA